METETIARPNGKPYRPRTAPRVAEYVDMDERTCVVVLFTHDAQQAREQALHLWQCHTDCALPAGTRSWLRLVPFDTGSGYERNWIVDPVRGTACVVFSHDECCP